MIPTIHSKFYTQKEVQRILGVSRISIYKYRRQGKLLETRIGKKLRFSEENLNAFLAAGTRQITETLQ